MKVERITPPAPTVYRFVCDYEEAITIRMALRDAYERYQEAAAREEWKRWADQITEVTG